MAAAQACRLRLSASYGLSKDGCKKTRIAAEPMISVIRPAGIRTWTQDLHPRRGSRIRSDQLLPMIKEAAGKSGRR